MKQIQIDRDDLAFHSLSFNDENGRLFKWQGDIYRAISPHQAPLYQDLLQQGIVSELVSKKLLIETELTNFIVENYTMVLKHRRLDFVSYPKEWCGDMLKDAALLHLDLCLELERHGLTTNDAHSLNILFDKCQPIFIDFGSIKQISSDSSLDFNYRQFCRFFLNPLRLMSQGQGRIARWLMHDYERGVLPDDVEALNCPKPANYSLAMNNQLNWLKSRAKMPILNEITLWAKKARKIASPIFPDKPDKPTSRRDFLEQIRQEVIDLNPVSLPAYRSNLECEWLDSVVVVDERQLKLQIVDSTLNNLQPAAVLEMGSDRSDGDYAQIAARNGRQVVFITPEEKKAKQLYLNGKKNHIPILPLLIDFGSPSSDLCNRWFVAAGDRLKCDMVLALDLIEWLVFKRYLPFDRIIELLAEFARRWLLVEFVIPQPLNLDSLSLDIKLIFSWYNLDNFIKALKQKFSRVDTLHHSANTVLLLCEK